ncbi:MAG TPA: ATP-binding protein [Acetobacteraceae bacterium]|nr:ATP-binding protein [Acetobacteraceae bacterium]
MSAEGILWALLAITLLGWVVSTYSTTRRATRMIIRLAQSERALQEARQRESAVKAALDAERALVARLPDPLLVLRPDRSVQHMNAAARSALGPGVPSLLRHPAFRAALERAQAEGEDQFAELSLPVPVARELHATVLAPAPESGGRLVAVLSDRTRDRAVERMRADFVANVSHELRTPLASLIGFIDTLRGPAADDKQAQTRFLGIMAEQARRMNRLIDDLLGLSRIELSEHLPPSGRVVVSDLVRRVTAAFAPLCAARRVTLETDLHPDVSELPGDDGQLEQVLQNLVDNALKYGREDGRVRITARRAARAGRDGVAIQVQDNGQGIAREHLPRLTERFYRVDAHRSRAVGGTGLGLAIVKHIVNRHRGHLAIDSTEGVGTTVTVWLPM